MTLCIRTVQRKDTPPASPFPINHIVKEQLARKSEGAGYIPAIRPCKPRTYTIIREFPTVGQTPKGRSGGTPNMAHSLLWFKGD